MQFYVPGRGRGTESPARKHREPTSSNSREDSPTIKDRIMRPDRDKDERNFNSSPTTGGKTHTASPKSTRYKGEGDYQKDPIGFCIRSSLRTGVKYF